METTVLQESVEIISSVEKKRSRKIGRRTMGEGEREREKDSGRKAGLVIVKSTAVKPVDVSSDWICRINNFLRRHT